MDQPPDLNMLTSELRSGGLSRAAARRMAREWLEHREDIESAAMHQGFSRSSAAVESASRLGDVSVLIDSVQTQPVLINQLSAQIALTTDFGRWGSACIAGFIVTCTTFVGMTLLIAM